MADCFFCDSYNFEKEHRKLELEDKEGYWYLSVPNQIGSYGQVLFIVTKLDHEEEHIKNITDSGLIEKPERLVSILKGISKISKKLMKLKDKTGRKVRKVYVITQGESINHLHFHLIPRYEGDSMGNEFLYKVELEEARWDNKKKIDPSDRIREGENIVDYFRKKIETDQFLYSREHKQESTKDVVKELNRIFGSS